MFKKISLLLILIFSVNFISFSQSEASSRFDSIRDASNNKDKKSKGKKGSLNSGPAQPKNDLLFLGVYESYIPKMRKNIKLTIYAEPAKFKYARRACTKVIKMRDRINTYFYKNPPKMISKSKVDTSGLDTGVRKAIKKALKTKREYFTSIYVISGSYNTYKKANDFKELSIIDCAGVIEKASEMEKAAKKK